MIGKRMHPCRKFAVQVQQGVGTTTRSSHCWSTILRHRSKNSANKHHCSTHSYEVMCLDYLKYFDCLIRACVLVGGDMPSLMWLPSPSLRGVLSLVLHCRINRVWSVFHTMASQPQTLIEMKKTKSRGGGGGCTSSNGSARFLYRVTKGCRLTSMNSRRTCPNADMLIDGTDAVPLFRLGFIPA